MSRSRREFLAGSATSAAAFVASRTEAQPPAPTTAPSDQQLGMKPVEVTLPDWPYDSLKIILFGEAAASFQRPV